MDLNDLLHHHQIALAHADGARSADARRLHRDRTRDYAARIADLRLRLGAGRPMVIAA